MKKNHRRFSMIAMLIAMLLFSSVTCFASGPIPPIDDSAGGNNIQRNVKDPTHVPRGAAEISQEELQVWLKENEKERLPQFESSSIKASTASWIYTHNTSYTFYYYGQELYYSCGAASVRMALKGLSNLNLSESEIRQGCKTDAGGTFVKYMTPYLNKKQNNYTYHSRYSIVQSGFHTFLHYAVSNGAPPIIGIKANAADGWFYETSGHFIVAYGIKSDESSYALADPWGGYAGVNAWKWYTKSAADVWAVYTSLIGYIS